MSCRYRSFPLHVTYHFESFSVALGASIQGDDLVSDLAPPAYKFWAFVLVWWAFVLAGS
jgi:hypothetical protein